MRKRICKRSIGLLALVQIAVLTLWGCGDIDETESQTLQPEVKDITEKKIVKTPDDYSSEDASVSDVIEKDTLEVDIGVDLIKDVGITATDEAEYSSSDSDYVDLTILSSTVVYAEVYNMMYYPENYIGKTIKMKGLYDDYFDETTGKRYHACIIMDATACCAQGIEFVLTDDYEYPADYPQEADDITVEGVFDVYTEESGEYCTLRNAKLL